MGRQSFQIMMAVLVVLGLLAAGSIPTAAQDPDQAGTARVLARSPAATEAGLLEELNQATGGQVRISYHAQTGKVRFVGTDLEHPIPQPAMLDAEATPEDAARAFLSTYGSLFGLAEPGQELAVMRAETRDQGRSFVRFQELYQGVPVVGGELIVQVDSARDVVSVNGEVLPGLDLDVTPRLTAAAAQERAIQAVAEANGLAVDELIAGQPELWIYNPILLQPGPNLDALVWRLEVKARDLRPVRELVLVEATTGLIALHFNQIGASLNRQIYDNYNNPTYGLPGNGPVRVEGGGPTGVTDVNNAYDYAGDTYDFYYAHHSRDSLDGAGMTLVNTVRYCPNASECPYENAFWNGGQMVFGAGYASADDVVGHRL
jgi:bacillolysin